jgi:ATP-binding cassette, subfamily B, bacterial PglK
LDVDKSKLIKLALLSIIVSVVEVVGITAVMPFISIASDFSYIASNQYLSFVYQLFDFESKIEFLLLFGGFLIVFYFFRGGLNIFYYAKLAKFSRGYYHILAKKIFNNFIHRKYIDFLDLSNPDITKAIINEAQGVTTIISSILLILSEIFIIVLILAVMMYKSFTAALFVFIILGGSLFVIKKTVSVNINRQGIIREKYQKGFYSIINSSFGNFKLLKLIPNLKLVSEKFDQTSKGFSDTQIKFETLIHIPRIAIEFFGFSIVILLVMYFMAYENKTIQEVMPIITLFVLSLYRLLPSVNRIITNYNNIEYYSKSLSVVKKEISYAKDKALTQEVKFNKNIQLRNIAFRYGNKSVLNNINLTINCNDKVAIIGESGSGKSTMIDILMGVLQPVDGNVLVDGNTLTAKNLGSWRKKIGYIPQHVYLMDGDVSDNVSFGRVVDKNKVIRALKIAHIYDFLIDYHEGVDTFVGDNGIKLSGGQRQRIAIARAFYDDPDVIILDEATSALDSDTETIVMDLIYKASKGKTMVVIAHRLSTISNCNKVYEIKDGKVDVKK